MLAALLWIGAAPLAAQVTFCEEGGLVAMQIESVPLAGDWVFESTIPSYTGSGYYRWNGADQFMNPGQGILTFNIEITTPGDYEMYWRNYHDDPDPGEENDTWLRVDGSQWEKCYSSVINQWNWHTQIDGPTFDYPPVFTLSAGSHTLEVSGRSHNFRIDRIHLALDTVANPKSPSSPESTSCTWQDLGNSLAGTAGNPQLDGTGTLVAGTPMSLDLTSARPLSNVALFVGASQTNLAFKGGVLVPAPDLLLGLFTTDGAGSLVLPSLWPGGLPSGALLYFQEWIIDPAGPVGLAASNGLQAKQP
jgi:hypothetical protein